MGLTAIHIMIKFSIGQGDNKEKHNEKHTNIEGALANQDQSGAM